MTVELSFQEQIKQGIPEQLPPAKPYPVNVNRAPKRKDILSKDIKDLIHSLKQNGIVEPL